MCASNSLQFPAKVKTRLVYKKETEFKQTKLLEKSYVNGAMIF